MDLTDLERAEPPLPTADETRVADLARRAVGKAVAQDRAERSGFTIMKFAQHERGYYHARVSVDGRPIYMDRRFGSWMCPGMQDGSVIMKEVEALVVGTSVQGRGKEIKEALQDRFHKHVKRLRKEAEQEENPDGEHDDGPDSEGTAGDGDTWSGGD